MGEQLTVRISAGFFLLVAALLMMLPIQWFFAIFFAAAIHELFHVAVIYLLDGKVYSFSLGIDGAVIETEQMQTSKELFCALAGPIGSALLLLLARWFPRMAICGAVHCMFNLLPLFPLDGGRILRCIIYLLFRPQRTEQIWKYSQILLRLTIAVTVVILAVRFGSLVLLCGIILLRGAREEKLLANRPFWRYNKGNIGKGVRL